MNKVKIVIYCIMILCIFCGCKKEAVMDYTVDYGQSSVYTEEEMDEAIKVVEARARRMKCSLTCIRYTSDKCNSDKHLDGINEDKEGNPYVNRIEFISDLKTSKNVHVTLVPNYVYKDWSWILAREEDGDWEIINLGVC